MGWFDVTLVLLKEKQLPISFLVDLHRNFKTINLKLEIDDYEFIVFNDTRDDKENQNKDLNKSMQSDEVIKHLCDWPGLGLLSYRHPDFNFSVTINYLTWDDKSINGFSIGFNGHEAAAKQINKFQLINDIAGLVNYQYTIGDIGDCSDNYIDLRENLSEVIRHIKNRKFEIDLRN